MNTNQIDNFFTEDKENPKPGLFPSKKQFKYLPKILSKKERNLISILALIIIGSLIYIPLSLYFNKTLAVAANGGEYVEGILGEPRHINPILAVNDADRDLIRLVYSSLTKYDEEGKIVGDLADYEISENGLTYTFFIKDDAQWHDGQDVTADDVVFTIKTVQDAEYNSPLRVNWQGIEVEKVDDKTVRFVLKSQYAQFLNNTTLGILPKHIWEEIKPVNFGLSVFNLEPIGSGPYVFKKFKKDSLDRIKSYELESNRKYYEGRPYIDKVELKFYSSEGELLSAYNRNEVANVSNISAQNINRLKFQQKLDIKRLKLPRYFTVFFNESEGGALSDPDIRQALNYATDKNEIIKEVLDEEAIAVNSPMIASILGGFSNLNPYEFNPEKAKELLAESEAEELSIALTTSEFPEFVIVSNILKEQWEAVGFKVNLQIVNISTMQQLIKDRAYEALLFGEVLAIDPDPFSFWHSSQKKSPGLNLSVYDNSKADQLLEEARTSLDPVKRKLAYEEFQKVILDDAPAVFLYSPLYIYPQNEDVKGNNAEIISIPSDRFANINQWYIDTKRIGK